MSYKPTILEVAAGGTGQATLTNHGILVGAATTAITQLAAGSSGQVLQSGGASADPAYSTSTFPSTATSTGTILRADGTNWVATTATYPATVTVNQILYGSSSNVVGGITAAANSMLISDASSIPAMGTSLLNDFTFTSATAGATRLLTVSNSNNSNTASNATIKVLTGGASAGDARYSASTTTTEWSFGVDNSPTSPTADPFVISQGAALGTNNIMSVATSGEINYPLQPAFLAVLSGADNNVTGNNTTFTIGTGSAFTEIFDQNSDFNTNGTFTAPVTGRYQLSFSVKVIQASGATTFTQTLVTSNRSYANSNTVLSVANQAGIISFLTDMDAADTATFTILLNGVGADTADISATGTTVSGYLAC